MLLTGRVQLRKSINKWLRRKGGFFDVHMDLGTATWTLFNSLQSFWSGSEVCMQIRFVLLLLLLLLLLWLL